MVFSEKESTSGSPYDRGIRGEVTLSAAEQGRNPDELVRDVLSSLTLAGSAYTKKGEFSLQWFVASFVTHRQPSTVGLEVLQSREYSLLLTAADADGAYGKTLSLANKTVGELTSGAACEWVLDGISELLIALEPPKTGANSPGRNRRCGPRNWLTTSRPKTGLAYLARRVGEGAGGTCASSSKLRSMIPDPTATRFWCGQTRI